MKCKLEGEQWGSLAGEEIELTDEMHRLVEQGMRLVEHAKYWRRHKCEASALLVDDEVAGVKAKIEGLVLDQALDGCGIFTCTCRVPK